MVTIYILYIVLEAQTFTFETGLLPGQAGA